MPVDLSPAGLPSAYPSHGPRFWPWLGIWTVCNVLGASLVVVLWPTGTPTHGVEFWGWVFGIPNAVFVVLLGLDRTGFEALWIHAHYRNIHRRKWLDDRVGEAQQPLQVLGTGYSLSLGNQTLGAAIATTDPLPKSQAPRIGSAVLVHGRFEETSSYADDPTDVPSDDDEAGSIPPLPPRRVATISLKIAQALESLADSLHALSQYESIHWPQVRVLASPDEAAQREQQVRDALRIAGLPPLECHAVPAADGLLVADAWLDARERRPLLVLAAAWHDANPPVGSTEGCVAILLDPGFYRLPEPVKAIGALHRPVAGDLPALGDLFANAAIWGKADGPGVKRAWITGLSGDYDTALLAGLRHASLSAIAKQDAQWRLDRILGDAGAANGWLSIAAAIESAESGPQFILNHAQAAILYVHPHPPHDNPHE